MGKIKVITKLETTDGKLFDSELEAKKHQEEIDELSKNSFFLPWEYCECGCHGWELTLGNRYFWSTSAEDKSSRTGRRYFLGEGHGYISSKRIGEYESCRELDEALVPLAKVALSVGKKSVATLKSILKEYESQKK